MSYLWQFGNEGDGMLIVAADTAEEARTLRDEWLVEQERLTSVLNKWWIDTEEFRTKNGWIKEGAVLAVNKYGPRPEGGTSYYQNPLDGEPENIGKTYTYQWYE